MKSDVHWVVEFDIKAGQLETLKAVMRDMVKATKANEPDTMHYEWFAEVRAVLDGFGAAYMKEIGGFAR